MREAERHFGKNNQRKCRKKRRQLYYLAMQRIMILVDLLIFFAAAVFHICFPCPDDLYKRTADTSRMRMFELWKCLFLLEMLAWSSDAAYELNFGSSKNVIGDNQIRHTEKERFVKFDAKDGEVEIELGISVPVMKVPLVGKQMTKEDTAISISAPGLLVAGSVIILTSFIIPALFSAKTYRNVKTDKEEFWKRMDVIKKNIFEKFNHSSTCLEGLICSVASKSKDFKGSDVGKWMDNLFKSGWVKNFINGTFVERAISYGEKGSECWKKYQDCQPVKKLPVKRG